MAYKRPSKIRRQQRISRTYMEKPKASLEKVDAMRYHQSVRVDFAKLVRIKNRQLRTEDKLGLPMALMYFITQST